MNLANHTIFWTVSFLFFFSGCKNKWSEKKVFSADSSRYIKYTFKGDKILSEQEFERNESSQYVAQGFYREYYENGKIAREFSYYNNRLNNIQKEYDRNGNIRRLSLTNGHGAEGFKMKIGNTGEIEDITGVPLHVILSDDKIVSRLDTLTIYCQFITTKKISSRFSFHFIHPQGDTLLKYVNDYKFGDRDFYVFNAKLGVLGIYRCLFEIELLDLNGKVFYHRNSELHVKCVEKK
ncbi:MAG: hypothetical protein JSS82_13840 [Bacteroidetes bacterium]|nr:hypothetical protein [Bacteroidota bacterium]